MKWATLTGFTFLFGLFAQATSITQDFTTFGGVQSGSGFSNVRTYTDNGVTITITAWGVTGNGNTTFQNANLGQYAGTNLGLGVCNQDEGLNCDSPNHQVDNANGYDFVLFQFSSLVSGVSININPYGTWDRSVTYYTGDAASGLNLDGATLAGLSALGLTNMQNNESTVSSTGRTVTLISGAVNSILFGARVNDPADIPSYFKISELSATVSSAPEPASFLLVGGSMIGLAALARRLNRR